MYQSMYGMTILYLIEMLRSVIANLELNLFLAVVLKRMESVWKRNIPTSFDTGLRIFVKHSWNTYKN